MSGSGDPGSDSGDPAAQGALPSLPVWSGSGLQRAVLALDRVSMGVVVLTMAGMSLIVVAQVFFRHVLNSSIDSADELSRLLFVWAMFLAIPHGIKYGVHVGIDLLIAYLRPRLREFVFRFTAAAGAALMVAVFIAAWVSTEEKWQQLMPTLPITASVFYICILVCAFHSLLHLILFTWGGSGIWGGRTL